MMRDTWWWPVRTRHSRSAKNRWHWHGARLPSCLRSPSSIHRCVEWRRSGWRAGIRDSGFGIGRGGGPAPIYLAGPHVFTSYSVIGPVNPQVAAQRCCESRIPIPVTEEPGLAIRDSGLVEAVTRRLSTWPVPMFPARSVIGPVNPQVAAQRCCESRFPNPGH
ncbi:hypothetical protein XFF6990_430031 [Xanthomonas citri pv. fuscans]|nr:hypothetical protein XFF6990_430031 [Xanthomonas citri pv. fuscans]